MKILISILAAFFLLTKDANAASFFKNSLSSFNQFISDIAEPFDIEEDHEAPSYSVLLESEILNERNGHENAGFLSKKSGFLPLYQSRERLPEEYEKWETIAENLPLEISMQTLRKKIEELPVINADLIPDHQLQRAATILSILAHSYAHSNLDSVSSVPESIYTPWSEVSRRLGRGIKPYMHYIDLIVFNWRAKANNNDEEINFQNLSIDNLELLVPTVNNQEERIFYLTQVEILAKTSKIVELVAIAQNCVVNDDQENLSEALNEILTILNTVQGSIRNINPKESSRNFVDPIVWAKTVAPLAVPLEKGPPGPSGTSSPFFHLFDTFIERDKYSSDLGIEALAIRKTFPSNWKRFIDAVKEVSIDHYILGKGSDDDLVSVWRKIKETYYGKILGFHKKKVFAYITHAFKTGRNNTIGGFEGNTREDGASKVDNALQNSRQERVIGCPFSSKMNAACPFSNTETESNFPHKFFSISQVIENNGVGNSRNFFIAEGMVYDAADYLSQHPGGRSLINLSSGRDITNELKRVSHLDGTIKKILKKYQIGILKEPQFNCKYTEGLYNSVKHLAFYLAEVESIYIREVDFLNKKLSSVENGDEYSAYKRNLFAGTAVRFAEEFVPAISQKVENVLRSASNSKYGNGSLEDDIRNLEMARGKSNLIVQSSYLGFSDDNSDTFKHAEIDEDEVGYHCSKRIKFISETKEVCLDLLRVFESSNSVFEIQIFLSKLGGSFIDRILNF